jgi:hypothetical protein
MKAFSDFIQSRNITNSPRGDFLADTKTLINCGKFPTVTCWGQLFAFVSSRHASPEAIAEARKLWRQYQKSLTLEFQS